MFHLKAIELIAKNLRDAVAEAKSDVPGSGREGMALAQHIAGMGFSNVGLGVDHSMAHTLSAHFDTRTASPAPCCCPSPWSSTSPS